jgi:hypothetical protein
MSKIPPTSKNEKSRSTPRPPSRTDPEITPLEQLITTVENTPGAVKNVTEARTYLEKRSLLHTQQTSTFTTLTSILLSLVITNGPRTTSERIPENAANIIKAVALLLEANITTNHATTATEPTSQCNDETIKILRTNSDLLNTIALRQIETIERTNAIAEKIDKIHTISTQRASQNSLPTSYRDILTGNMNGTPPSTPNTPMEACLRNRINIKACQVMIEIQSEQEDPLHTAYPDESDPFDKLKQAVDAWISTNKDDTTGPPTNSTIRSIKQYHMNRFLIEVNKCETADWIREHPESLHDIFKNQVRILNRLYPVVARFMPTHFQTDPVGLRELESSAKLNPHSIVRASWIKDPTRRSPGQKHTNIKLFCDSPEAANVLIMSNPQHLGTQIRTHKDIKIPGTCIKCQQYGHYAPHCKEESNTCGKCGNNHPTSECNTTTTKCTPCGSTEH